MNKRNLLILVVMVVLAAAPAFASGFGFYEQGAKASGQAGAWVARADDASANWYNPAALVHLTGREVQFGFNYLELGSDTQFSPAAASGVSIDAGSEAVFPSHFYFSQKINDRVAWGVGLNTPFGLISQWESPTVTPFNRRAELRTYLLNPNVAFKMGNYWSIGFGVDYIAVEIREFSTSTGNITGEGDAWGYNFALQFKNEYFSIAGQYRSSLSTSLYGDANFSPVLNPDASTHVDLPGQTMLGMAWTGERVDVEVGAYYTQWNYFKSLDVVFTNPNLPPLNLTENWEGTWAWRLGAAFRLGQEMNNELRVGLVYDESPIPSDYLRPSIPDSDRTGYTVGYGYLAKRWGIDLYGMYFDFDDATSTGVPADAVIPGTYTTTIWLVGATAKYRF